MSILQLDTLRTLGARLRDFINTSSTGKREVFLDSGELEEVNGICEPLYMTNLGDAVVVHYGTDGDWTKALLIPSGNFEIEEEEDFYGPVDEALDWFFS